MERTEQDGIFKGVQRLWSLSQIRRRKTNSTEIKDRKYKTFD
jgi:hypothetical protein